MNSQSRHGITVEGSPCDVTRARLLACGGVCGAVMVPASLLALFLLVFTGEPVGMAAIAAIVGIAAIGIGLMAASRRLMDDPDAALPGHRSIILVSRRDAA